MTSQITPDADDRLDVLIVAGKITANKADPHAVLANAGPLLAWLGQATTTDELTARHRAMMRHLRHLTGPMIGPAQPCPAEYIDNPAKFIAAADILLGFLMPAETA